MSEKAKWVESLWGFTNFNFKLNLKVSAFYLEKQKSFISKKKFFWAVVNIKTKKLCLLTQFSGRFWLTSLNFKILWKFPIFAMEKFCKRFPHLAGRIFDQVNDESLNKCKEINRDVLEYLEKERFFWIRIIKVA